MTIKDRIYVSKKRLKPPSHQTQLSPLVVDLEPTTLPGHGSPVIPASSGTYSRVGTTNTSRSGGSPPRTAPGGGAAGAGSGVSIPWMNSRVPGTVSPTPPSPTTLIRKTIGGEGMVTSPVAPSSFSFNRSISLPQYTTSHGNANSNSSSSGSMWGPPLGSTGMEVEVDMDMVQETTGGNDGQQISQSLPVSPFSSSLTPSHSPMARSLPGSNRKLKGSRLGKHGHRSDSPTILGPVEDAAQLARSSPTCGSHAPHMAAFTIDYSLPGSKSRRKRDICRKPLA